MPALAVESGPAAGVVAAALVARQTGRLDLLSFDMGGTTAKASLIRAGQYETTPDYEVGGGSSMSRWMHGTGHPIRVPVIDLAEVSAGGGSIAWVDRAGALRVGPKSAGADPGPVCYGRGGSRADRHRLQPAARLPRQGIAARRRACDRSCGGRGRDPRAACRAARHRCPQRCGRRHRRRQPRHGGSPEDRVCAARPRSARIRARRIRRGRAPARGRARRRARHRRGHLSADPRGVFGARPDRHRLEARLRAHALHHDGDRRSRRPSKAAFVALEREGAAMLERAGVAPARRQFERSVDARYARQSYELVDTGSAARDRCGGARPRSPKASTTATAGTYGHDNRSEPVQIVSIRVAAIGAIPPLTIRDRPPPAMTDAVKAKRAGLVPRRPARSRRRFTIAAGCRPNGRRTVRW